MNKTSISGSADTGSINIDFQKPKALIGKSEASALLSVFLDLFKFNDTDAIIDENLLNQKRLEILRHDFTEDLILLIREDDFEYGIETKADVLVRRQMELNALATRSWLNSIFVERFTDPMVVIGLLRIIARLDYLDIYPEGQTMAVAALSHSNIDVQESGIRAFESWENLQSLQILEGLEVSTDWLQEYVDDVIQDLRIESYDTVS